jgi:hypothetical protein
LNGYAAISGQVPASASVIINLLATILASYFHVNPSQSYTPPTQ